MDTADSRSHCYVVCISFLCSCRRERSFHTTTLLPHLNNFHSEEHRLPALETFPGEDHRSGDGLVGGVESAGVLVVHADTRIWIRIPMMMKATRLLRQSYSSMEGTFLTFLVLPVILPEKLLTVPKVSLACSANQE